jgi:hypothetical protein
MPTWTTIKLVGAGIVLMALLGTCGYYIWNYHHMAAVIEDLKLDNANLKLGQGVLDQKQQKYDEFMAKAKTVKGKVKYEQDQITQEVDTADDAGLNALYNKYRLHPSNQVRTAAPGGKGGAQHAAP